MPEETGGMEEHMKVILIEDVKSLGKKGDLVNVSDGYARNALFPKKLALEATTKNINDLKLQKAHQEKVAKENLDHAKAPFPQRKSLKPQKLSSATIWTKRKFSFRLQSKLWEQQP